MVQSHIDQVSGAYFRKGPCVVCGKQAERTRTITANSYQAMEQTAYARQTRPLMHKKCERNYLGEDLPW